MKQKNIDEILTQKLGKHGFRFNMNELFELAKNFQNKSNDKIRMIISSQQIELSLQKPKHCCKD